MTGDFKITHEHLKSLVPCASGWRDFLTHFPEAEYPDGVGYQFLLDYCCEHDKSEHATWLLSKLGPTTDVLEVESIETDKSIVYAGSINAVGYINAVGDINAGLGINAGGDINAGEDIEAGWDINAVGDIEAGLGINAGGGIEAGLGINAGGGIKAGWDIKAGGGIKAGWDIKAGGYINAGKDYGIYAGLSTRISDTIGRQITAKTKPERIMCGVWHKEDTNHDRRF